MKLLKALKSDSKESLKYHLHKTLAGYRPGRSKKYIHASELTRADQPFCAREWALHGLLDVKVENEWLGACERFTFRMGHMIQDLVTEVAIDAGIAVGDWECEVCGKVLLFSKPPKGCTECNAKKKFMKYREIRMSSSVTGASAGLDLLVDLDTGKHKIVEIKSILQDKFKMLVMPLAEHTWRTRLYLKIAAECGSDLADRIDTDSALVLYVCKQGWGESDQSVKQYDFSDKPFTQFKEFVVVRNDEEVKTLSENAKALFSYRNEGGPLPSGVCPTQFVKRAQLCPVAQACFSGEYK